jgi:hypothetical protein
MDRRVPVFVVCSMLCAVLTPLCEFGEDDFRWVPATFSVVYLVLAVLVFLDWSSRRGRHRSPKQPAE